MTSADWIATALAVAALIWNVFQELAKRERLTVDIAIPRKQDPDWPRLIAQIEITNVGPCPVTVVGIGVCVDRDFQKRYPKSSPIREIPLDSLLRPGSWHEVASVWLHESFRLEPSGRTLKNIDTGDLGPRSNVYDVFVRSSKNHRYYVGRQRVKELWVEYNSQEQKHIARYLDRHPDRAPESWSPPRSE